MKRLIAGLMSFLCIHPIASIAAAATTIEELIGAEAVIVEGIEIEEESYIEPAIVHLAVRKPEREDIKIKEETKRKFSDTIQILVTEEQRISVNQKIDSFTKELKMLAQVTYSEAGGIPDDHHRAAVMWCVLNRVDIYNGTVEQILTYPNAFAYNAATPVTEDLYALAQDVVTRWLLEKEGIIDVGRTLPANYLYFHGDGQYNYFRIGFTDNTYWDWSLPIVY